MTILVDGDCLVYRCGFAGEKTHYLVTEGIDSLGWDEFDNAKAAKAQLANLGPKANLWTRKSVDPVENVLHSVKSVLQRIEGKFPDVTSLQVFLGGSNNYRNSLATRAKYKGNRDSLPKPVHYSSIREYLTNHWGASLIDGQEVDDELGIRAKKGDVLVHNDKDINQVEGIHYNPFSDSDEPYTVSKAQGYKFFLEQCLTGDATDNILGLEGIGPVRAKRILEGVKGPRDGWTRVLEAYQKQFANDAERMALETARLVWIRRKSGEIWSPPN